jgi:hypothetical protein
MLNCLDMVLRSLPGIVATPAAPRSMAGADCLARQSWQANLYQWSRISPPALLRFLVALLTWRDLLFLDRASPARAGSPRAARSSAGSAHPGGTQ